VWWWRLLLKQQLVELLDVILKSTKHAIKQPGSLENFSRQVPPSSLLQTFRLLRQLNVLFGDKSRLPHGCQVGEETTS